MFKEIREKVHLLDAIKFYTKQDITLCGTDTYQLDDTSCPFCGHHDCFKVKSSEDACNYKCFSCDEWGTDAVAFLSKLKNLDAYSAGRRVASDFKVPLENTMSTPQKIFELAASYFHNALYSCKDEILAGGVQYTPLSYQLEKRKHKDETLRREMVGYNDGNLIRYLTAFDFTEEEMEESGLLVRSKKQGGGGGGAKYYAFLKKGCFVYPHFVKGQVSHFTQKDPVGETPPYQIRNENRLNGYMFYGQDSAFRFNKVVVVEGENDRLSLLDHAAEAYGVLATIGMPSGAQKKWLEVHCADKEIITIFDNDEAGGKYRNMFWKLGLPSLKQYHTPEPHKDIDELLKSSAGAGMEDLVEECHPDKAPVEGAEVVDGHQIFELDGCYCRLKINATTGERHVVRITNFVIQLRNVFVKGDGERSREIVVIRNDGARSAPMLVTSEVKVSMHAFKEAMADAVDASFYGKDTDLLEMWDYIYAKGADRIVKLPKEVGRLEETGGWLFADCYITPSGSVVTPDSEGVMWVGGNTLGIKPASINVRNKSNAVSNDVPKALVQLSDVERREFRRQFFKNFITNIGSIGPALTMLSWSNANAYSDFLFARSGFFPFLFIWGRHGKGKTSITRWLLELYGMDQIGSSTIPQLVSGVGFTRQLSYFSSLPLLLDEVRADKETKEFYGYFRAWYNRQGRSMGAAKDTRSIVTQEVRANVMFCGQDVFTDPATRSRCLEVQMPTHGRELEKTYLWIENNADYLRSIGFQWILESTQCDIAAMYKELGDLEKHIITNARCDSRAARHWAIVAYFSKRIQAELELDFDMLAYIYQACSSGFEEQKTDDLVIRFFTAVEGMQCMEHTEIDGRHMRVEGNVLYVWTMEIIRLVRARGGPSEGERFSKNALCAAIRDEESFIAEDRKQMGADGMRRRCHTFDILKAPEVIQNIAAYANKVY